jgi:uncharacterized membrane protein
MGTPPRSLLPLLACSALCVALLVGRVAQTGSLAFLFLPWNLLLAWVPFGCSQLAARLGPRASAARLVPLGLLWLLFFPNAPYLVTDLLHLRARPPVPLWYDLALLTTFAWTGMLLGLASLGGAHRLVRARLGGRAGWAFVCGSAALSGLGIYLGRFGRWNSWDVVVQPGALFMDLATRCAHPLQHGRTWGVSLVFGGLLLTSYLAVEARREVA